MFQFLTADIAEKLSSLTDGIFFQKQTLALTAVPGVESKGGGSICEEGRERQGPKAKRAIVTNTSKEEQEISSPEGEIDCLVLDDLEIPDVPELSKECTLTEGGKLCSWY